MKSKKIGTVLHFVYVDLCEKWGIEHSGYVFLKEFMKKLLTSSKLNTSDLYELHVTVHIEY